MAFFQEFFCGTLHWDEARLRPDGATYAAEALAYHPTLSGGAGGGGSYPSDCVERYLRSLHTMLESSYAAANEHASAEDAARLQRVSASLLGEAEARALRAVRAGVLESTRARGLPDSMAATEFRQDERWAEALERVAAAAAGNAGNSAPVLTAGEWALARPMVERMSRGHRLAWLRFNAAPAAAVDDALHKLLSSVQKSINKVTAEARGRIGGRGAAPAAGGGGGGAAAGAAAGGSGR